MLRRAQSLMLDAICHYPDTLHPWPQHLIELFGLCRMVASCFEKCMDKRCAPDARPYMCAPESYSGISRFSVVLVCVACMHQVQGGRPQRGREQLCGPLRIQVLAGHRYSGACSVVTCWSVAAMPCGAAAGLRSVPPAMLQMTCWSGRAGIVGQMLGGGGQ